MSGESKRYAVQYDIQADTTAATTSLTKLQEFAGKINQSFAQAPESIKELNKAVSAIRDLNIKAPTLDLAPYRIALNTLKTEVLEAATQMQIALQEVFNPKNPRSVRKNFLESELASTKEAIKNTQKAIEKITQDKGISTEKRQGTLPSGRKIEFFGRGTYAQAAEAERANMDRALEEHYKNLDHYQKEVDRINKAIAKNKVENSKGVVEESSLTNPRVVKGITEDLKKAVTDIKNKLPKVPLQFDLDLGSLKNQLGEVTNKAYDVTITPVLDNNAIGKLRSQLQNLSNTARNSTDNAVKKTAEEVQQNTTLSKPAPSTPKGNPLTAEESSRLAQLKRNGALQNLEDAKRKLINAKRKLIPDKPKTQENYNNALNSYKQALNEARPIQEEITALEKKSFQSSSMRVLSDHELTQGSRWVNAVDRLKKMKEQASGPRLQKINKAIDTGEERINALLRPRNIAPTMSEAEIMISVGLNLGPALSDLSRLEQFIREQTVTLNIKAINETAQIKDQVKKIVETGKHKKTTIEGAHIPIPVILDTSAVNPQVTTLINQLEKKKVTLTGTIHFAGIDTKITDAVKKAQNTVDKQLLKIANNRARVISEGGIVSVSKNSKDTVAALKANLEAAIASIPKNLTNVPVSIWITPSDASLFASKEEIQGYFNLNPFTVKVRLVPEQENAPKTLGKKKGATTQPVTQPTVSPMAQTMTDLHTKLKEELGKTTENMAEVMIQAKLNLGSLDTELGRIQSHLNTRPVEIWIKPIVTQSGIPTFKEQLLKGVSKTATPPVDVINSTLNPLTKITPFKEQVGAITTKNTEGLTEIRVGIDTNYAFEHLNNLLLCINSSTAYVKVDINDEPALKKIIKIQGDVEKLKGKQLKVGLTATDLDQELRDIQIWCDRNAWVTLRVKLNYETFQEHINFLKELASKEYVSIKALLDISKTTKAISGLQTLLNEESVFIKALLNIRETLNCLPELQTLLNEKNLFIKIRLDFSTLQQEITALQYELDAKKVYARIAFDPKQINEGVAQIQAELGKGGKPLQISSNIEQILKDLNAIVSKLAQPIKGNIDLLFTENGTEGKLAALEKLLTEKASINVSLNLANSEAKLTELNTLITTHETDLKVKVGVTDDSVLKQLTQVIDAKKKTIDVNLNTTPQGVVADLTKIINTSAVNITANLQGEAVTKAQELAKLLEELNAEHQIKVNTTNALEQIQNLVNELQQLSKPINVNLQGGKPGQNEEKTGGTTTTGTTPGSKTQPTSGTSSNQTSPVTSAQNVKDAATNAAGAPTSATQGTTPTTPTTPTTAPGTPPKNYKPYKPMEVPEDPTAPKQYTPRTQDDVLRWLNKTYSMRAQLLAGLTPEAEAAATDPFFPLKFSKLENRLLKYSGNNTTRLKMLVEHHPTLSTAMNMLKEEGQLSTANTDAFTLDDKIKILNRTMALLDQSDKSIPPLMSADAQKLQDTRDKLIAEQQKTQAKLQEEQAKADAKKEEEKNRLKRQKEVQERKWRAEQLRSSLVKKLLPFAGNDGKLANILADNYRHIVNAAQSLGYMPNQNTSAAGKAKVLDEAINRMRIRGITPPKELKNLSENLNSQANSVYNQFRKKGIISQIRLKYGLNKENQFKDLPVTTRQDILSSLLKEFRHNDIGIPKSLEKMYQGVLTERDDLANAMANGREQAAKVRVQNSIASKTRRASRLKDRMTQDLLPRVGEDSKLAKFITDNRRHFINVANDLGYTAPKFITDLTERRNYLRNMLSSLSQGEWANYLKQVTQSLEKSNKTTPTAIKEEIKKAKEKEQAQNIRRLREEAVSATRTATGLNGRVASMGLEDKTAFYKALMKEYSSRGLSVDKLLKTYTNLKNALQAENVGTTPTTANSADQLRSFMGQAQQRTGMDISKLGAPEKASSWLRYYNELEKIYAENNASMPKGLTDKKKVKESEFKNLQTQRLNRIKNAVSSYVTSGEMRNAIAENWRAFYRAAVENQIHSLEEIQHLNEQTKLKLLKDVKERITKEGRKTVPMALEKEIQKLQKQILGQNQTSSSSSGGSGGGTVPPSGTSGKGRTPYEKPLYDRARKWAYPFSGQTSFGVRTPMMVDMAKGMGVMFAIGGAMSAIGDSFSQAMEYQNTMETTKAILQHGTDTFGTTNYRNMEHIIRDVGIKTKFSAPEVANAARFLAMAGYNIEDINNSIRPIADIALIGDTDLGETADKVTNIMTTFGIDSNRMREIANILTTTATRSNTDIMMLAEAAKYGGGVAHMYGANDPNLFADTMALFGVMGNAGIQGSSAGTGLRMMYQNIFNPNKKQKAILKELEKRGIKTKNADGSFVSMAQFVRDVATKITDPKELAAVVGSLFRITAQPAANAAIMAAVGGDTDALKDTLDKFQKIEKSLLEKGGLSKLADLMEANHRAINGNISGDVAEKKQNTIQGLLAQVTSTFTEGIVKAFESRQGGFEGMLKSIRDFLAQPQTATMLRNLLDLIVEIGKIMGTFVKIWADFYHSFPGAIKLWMTLQMVFTQFGYLLSPFVALLGVANRIGGTIMKFTGGGLALKLGGGAAAASSGLTNSALLLSGSTLFSTAKKRPLPNQARIASNMLSSNMLLNGVTMAQNYPLPPLSPTPLAASITPGTSLMAATAMAGVAPNAEIERHNKAVRARAWKMYGLPKAAHTILAPWSKKSFASFWSMLPAIFSGIGKMLLGIVNSLASVLALLINPITLLIGGITGVVYGVWKINQLFNGQSEAQIQAFENTKQLADQARFEREKNSQWLAGLMKNKDSDFYKEHGNGLVGSVALSKKGEATLRYEAMMEARKKNYPELFKDKLTNNVSHRRTVMAAEEWRNSLMDDTLSRLALGDNYLENTKDTLNPTRDTTFTGKYAGLLGLGAQLYYILYGDKKNAEMVEQQRALDFVKVEAANDSRVKQAVEEAEKIYTQYINKKIKEDEYKAQIQAIKNKYIPKNIESARSATSLNLTPQELLEYGDIASLREYQEGLANVINAALDPEHSGSPFAYANAVIKLASNAVQEGTTDWMKYIGDIINNSELKSTLNLFSGEVVDWALKLRALPNGNVDVDFVIRQIQDKVKSYKKNLQDVATISASVYKLLADNGFLTANAEGARKYVSDQLGNKVGESMASAYYDKYLAIGGNFLGTKDQFMKWLFGTEEEKSKTFKSSKTGNILSRNRTLRKILETTINDTVKDTFGADFLNGTSEEGTESKDSGKGDKNPTTNLLSSLDHSDYASGYEKVNKVSQVHMAFNAPLVQFSDTAISSSAEERDIMMAIEEKCANVVLMAVTSAMSQATQTYDA